MENEVMDTMTEVIDIDKAEEVLELVVMSDYSKGFIHGGVAVGGALAVKKLWDNRETIKLKSKMLFNKIELPEEE